MSRKLMVVMVAIFLVALMAAPSFAGGKMGFGGKAGLNLAKFWGTDAGGAGSRTGFALGGYIDLPFSPNIAFHPEVMYWQGGTSANLGSIDGTFKMDYVQIPVLLLFRVPSEGSQVVPMFYIGPSFGVKMGAKVKVAAGGQSGEVDIENAKSLDVAIAFGGGAEVAMGANRLTFDVRYTLGVTKAFEEAMVQEDDKLYVTWDDGSAPSIMNGTISILVGFGL